mgnify:FL=1
MTAVVGILVGYAYHRDFSGSWEKLQANKRAIDQLRQQEIHLKAQRDEIKKSVDGLSSDPVEMEESVRRNKSLVREGETVYRIELPPR